jgi:predicted branched-subunit amino acid permease
MYILTDESWAIAERKALSGPLDLGYMLGSSLFLWPTWFACSFVGAAIGKNLGDPARLGLDFAFAAIFITIIMGFWKGARTGAVIMASAMVAAAFKLLVPGAWYILAGGLAGVSAAAALYREGEA